jgi:hypothetical protein
MFKDYCDMKKNYNCPETEVIAVNATYSICAESTPFNYGGASIENADPV